MVLDDNIKRNFYIAAASLICLSIYLFWQQRKNDEIRPRWVDDMKVKYWSWLPLVIGIYFIFDLNIENIKNAINGNTQVQEVPEELNCGQIKDIVNCQAKADCEFIDTPSANYPYMGKCFNKKLVKIVKARKCKNYVEKARCDAETECYWFDDKCNPSLG